MYINGQYKSNIIEDTILKGNYDIFYIDNTIINPYYEDYESKYNISIYKTGKVLCNTNTITKKLIDIFINQSFNSNIINNDIIVCKLNESDKCDYKFIYNNKIFKYYDYNRLIKNYIHIYEVNKISNIINFDFISQSNIIITLPNYDNRQSNKYYAFKIYDEVTCVLDACGIYR